jgi:hypothetical protein
MKKAEKHSGKPKIVHWEKDGAGSYYVPLTGDFLRTLQQAVHEVSI